VKQRRSQQQWMLLPQMGAMMLQLHVLALNKQCAEVLAAATVANCCKMPCFAAVCTTHVQMPKGMYVASVMLHGMFGLDVTQICAANRIHICFWAIIYFCKNVMPL
jgi:hypothetical protein